MTLQIQISSLVYSFVFGIFFGFCVNFHYALLFSQKKWFQILINFIFVVDMSLIYFLVLKILNGGVLHFYFFLLIFLGFLLGFCNTKQLRNFLQKFKKVPKKE